MEVSFDFGCERRYAGGGVVVPWNFGEAAETLVWSDTLFRLVERVGRVFLMETKGCCDAIY
jgi:hypothetical protein